MAPIAVPLFLMLVLLAAARPQAAAAERHMNAPPHALAAEAGLAALREGGGAFDAAVAAQAVLTLVEPRASGIGGGALMLHWDGAARPLSAWDGREVAPAAARHDLFSRPGWAPTGFHEAAVGGRAAGVPVEVRPNLSGLNAIRVRRGSDGARRLLGGAAPRRKGVAIGD